MCESAECLTLVTLGVVIFAVNSVTLCGDDECTYGRVTGQPTGRPGYVPPPAPPAQYPAISGAIHLLAFYSYFLIIIFVVCANLLALLLLLYLHHFILFELITSLSPQTALILFDRI